MLAEIFHVQYLLLPRDAGFLEGRGEIALQTGRDSISF
jgi:hypothetical protein